MSLSNLSAMSGAPPANNEENDLIHTPEYLSWRRLQLSKSKLSNVAEMASFMAGFAVVATVELQINDEDVNPVLLTAFVLTTAFLVGTSMIAIIIATCVLPHIQAVAKMSMISEVNQSPHDAMIHLIDLSWVLANTASLFLFTLDVIIMCWIKFTFFSKAASIAATAIMAPVLFIILIFGIVFYRKIIKHQYIISNLKYEELERMKEEIDKQTEIIENNSRVHFSASRDSSMRSVGSTTNNTVVSFPRNLVEASGDGPSLRSRTSSESEGSFSKKQRRTKGSIFIV